MKKGTQKAVQVELTTLWYRKGSYLGLVDYGVLYDTNGKKYFVHLFDPIPARPADHAIIVLESLGQVWKERSNDTDILWKIVTE